MATTVILVILALRANMEEGATADTGREMVGWLEPDTHFQEEGTSVACEIWTRVRTIEVFFLRVLGASASDEEVYAIEDIISEKSYAAMEARTDAIFSCVPDMAGVENQQLGA